MLPHPAAPAADATQVYIVATLSLEPAVATQLRDWLDSHNCLWPRPLDISQMKHYTSQIQKATHHVLSALPRGD